MNLTNGLDIKWRLDKWIKPGFQIIPQTIMICENHKIVCNMTPQQPQYKESNTHIGLQCLKILTKLF